MTLPDSWYELPWERDESPEQDPDEKRQREKEEQRWGQ